MSKKEKMALNPVRTNYCPIVILAVVVAFQTLADRADASEFSGIATITSEYIYRGLEVSAGDPALQLGLDYAHDSGFFAGVWATTADLTSAAGQREVELDFYLGYQFLADAPVPVTATVLHYTYPDQSAIRNYNYTELLLSAALGENYSVEFAYTRDLYGFDNTGRHWALRSEWPVKDAWVIGGSIGNNDMSDRNVSRYWHWDIGASARFSRLTFDLRWYDSEQVDGFAVRYSARSRAVLSVSTAF